MLPVISPIKVSRVHLRISFLLCVSSSLLGSCSSAVVYDKDREIHKIHKVILSNLRARRPPSLPADPKADPGGEDYRSQPVPDSRFDCQPIRDLFKGVLLKELRECLSKTQQPITVFYRLRRMAQPYWRIEEDEEEVPACLKRALPEIPIPREIVFQSNDEGPMQCYSARLDISSDELLSAKMPMDKWLLKISFPISDPYKDEEQALKLLTAWALSPFLNLESREMNVRIVTEQFCKACIGEWEMFQQTGRPFTLWPE